MPWSDDWYPAAERYSDYLTKSSNADQSRKTGGMIALYPRQDDAQKLAIPGGELPEHMHVTLAFLGDDVTGLDPSSILEELPRLLDPVTVITARVMGYGLFNPDGGPDGDKEPCSVYLIGDTEQLPELHDDVMDLLSQHSVDLPLPPQHSPYIPHITAGYSVPIASLSYTGPVLFDRVGFAFSSSVQYFPLMGSTA